MQQGNADPEEIVRVQKDLKEIQAFIDERKLGTTGTTSNSIGGMFERLMDLVGMKFYRERGMNTYALVEVLAIAVLTLSVVMLSGGSHSGRNAAVPLGNPRIGTGTNK